MRLSKNTNSSKPSEKASTLSKALLNNLIRVKLAKSLENNRFYAIKIIKRHQVERINLSAFKKILENEVHLI